MELMTSLLLCALAMPLAFGQTIVRTNTEIKYNTSKLINQKTVNHKKILLNINGPALVNSVSELQPIFVDMACRHCTLCMGRAIKAYKSNLHHLDRPSVEELQEEVLDNNYLHYNRDKRNTESTENHESATEQVIGRKPRIHKFVNVDKYQVNGEIYALRVNESSIRDGTSELNDEVKYLKACDVYSVKKSFPCDSPEAEPLLTVAKRKASKKTRREKDKPTIVNTTEKKISFPMFRKRHVDNSQVPENVMPSIEELY